MQIQFWYPYYDYKKSIFWKLWLLSTKRLCLRMCFERFICITVHHETLLMLSTVYLPCKTISVIGVCICKSFDFISLNCILMFCSFVFTRILHRSAFAKGVRPDGYMGSVGHWQAKTHREKLDLFRHWQNGGGEWSFCVNCLCFLFSEYKKPLLFGR